MLLALPNDPPRPTFGRHLTWASLKIFLAKPVEAEYRTMMNLIIVKVYKLFGFKKLASFQNIRGPYGGGRRDADCKNFKPADVFA